MKETDINLIRKHIKKRDADTHKGSYGRVLVIAGFGNMPGACFFAAKAALRSGSGLVYVLTAEENIPVIQTLVPEAVITSPEEVRRRIGGESEDWVYDAVCFGPGMGTGRDAVLMFGFLMENYEGKLIVDADGLNILAANNAARKRFLERKGESIITPHPGEAARLLKRENADIRDREKTVRMLSELYGCTALLKGHGTLISDGGETCMNTTGNPGMATAGSGDVLSGIILSFMGQRMSAFDAGVCAAFVHGLCGDIAAEKKTEYSLIASDLIEGLPDAFRQILD